MDTEERLSAVERELMELRARLSRLERELAFLSDDETGGSLAGGAEAGEGKVIPVPWLRPVPSLEADDEGDPDDPDDDPDGPHGPREA